MSDASCFAFHPSAVAQTSKHKTKQSRTYGIPCSQGAPIAPKIQAVPMVSRALRGLREHQKSWLYLWYPVLSGAPRAPKIKAVPVVSRALRGLREHRKSRPYLWYPVLSGGSESTKNPGRTYGIPCSQGGAESIKTPKREI